MSDSRIQQAGDGRMTLSVPIQIKRCNGRKLVALPSGETAPVRPWDVAPTTIQPALARSHRGLAMLESGEAKSLKEITTREGIDNSYVSRMVNLTTLAPDIAAAILDDALPNHITLFDLAVDLPALWDEQRARLVSTERRHRYKITAGAHLTCTRVKKGVASLSLKTSLCASSSGT